MQVSAFVVPCGVYKTYLSLRLMQHWALERDLEIVMINSLTLWGNERLVPRGPMRESLEAIERAHVVVLHHANLVRLLERISIFLHI